jgi:hemoglobin
MSDTQPAGSTMYERVGGAPWFAALVERFYRAVETDPVLRPLYPADPDAFIAARDHLGGFLVQYWGGPADYSARRGHPRLRMRHASFAVDQAARDAWFTHMPAAVRAGGLDPADEAEMLAYFDMAATHMINTG